MGQAVTAARAAIRNTVSGDYAMRSKFTVVGIARYTLSGDWAWAQVAMVGTASGTAYIQYVSFATVYA